MRYGSVCSGIEAASVAWHHLDWTPVFFSEIEAFPKAVLAHRFPDVPDLGDMTKFKEWPVKPGDIDLLVGGTPCQSFSIAGLRGGLEDPRGNLTLVFLSMIDWFKPKYLIWENVPGALSAKGNPVKCLIQGLEEIGYSWDADILDAQFYGVAQRRRRIFLVAVREDYLSEHSENLKEYQHYAGHADADLFSGIRATAEWTTFARQADYLDKVVEYLGKERGQEIQFIPACLSGDFAESAKEGKSSAGTFTIRAGKDGGGQRLFRK
jgi:DNA-cytosine methyltransferase